MVLVPEIKLIRTDTTLDLSQKAEKVWLNLENQVIYTQYDFVLRTVPDLLIRLKKCLEWGSNPRLHRRIELKSTALDHSAIEALLC